MNVLKLVNALIIDVANSLDNTSRVKVLESDTLPLGRRLDAVHVYKPPLVLFKFEISRVLMEVWLLAVSDVSSEIFIELLCGLINVLLKYHLIDGFGFPVAVHCTFRSSPINFETTDGRLATLAGSKSNSKKNFS